MYAFYSNRIAVLKNNGQLIVKEGPLNAEWSVVADDLQEYALYKEDIGFALSGGESKGDFQVGAIRLLFSRGKRPSIITCTSVGSINGVKLAEGGDDALKELEEIWKSLQTNGDMYNEEPWLSEIHPDLRKAFLDFLAGKGGSGQFMNWALFLPLIGGLVLSEIQNFLNKVRDNQPVFNLDPIEEKLGRLFNIEKMQQSGIWLLMAMVSMNTGRLQYVNEMGKLLPDGPSVDPIKAVIASAAEPVIFHTPVLNNEQYCDGGLREIVPINAAYDAGAGEVYAIIAGKAGVDEMQFENKTSLVDYLLRSIDILLANVKYDDINMAIAQGKSPVIIQPTITVHSGLRIDPGLISISIDYGYMRASDIIDSSTGEERYRLIETSDMIIQKRMEIWDLEYDANSRFRENDALIRPVFMVSGDPLLAVREKKKELVELVRQRKMLGGDMPPDFQSWWVQWERHPWDLFIIPTPWAAFQPFSWNPESGMAAFGPEIGEETPPSL
jgi:NTE family protein